MKEKILQMVTLLHVGGLLDGIIEASLSEDGIDKDKILKLVQENVQIKELISLSFQIGVDAIKEKAANDGKTDYLDALVPIIGMTSQMISDAIGEYLEKLLTKEEVAQ